MEILIVDGDVGVAEVLGHIVSALGHQERAACSFEAALEMARERSFDACVIDVDMLQNAALPLIQALRDRNPWIRTVSTSAVGELWEQQREKLTLDWHLAKPASIAWICAAIEGQTTENVADEIA